MKIAILRNEDPESGKKWEQACITKGISYKVINLTSYDWLNQVNSERFTFFLAKPSGALSHFKALYDERLYIVSKVLNYDVFPSYEECYIYENKKILSYFLQANEIPNPQTWVFYSKNEAVDFIKQASMPLVAKTSIGASGSGVKVIRNSHHAIKYISLAFSRKGVQRRFGPNRVIGTPKQWLLKALKSPSYFAKKIRQYFEIYNHAERDFVIFQEYIPHDFEWRIVKIGGSYFGHRKIKYRDKASGSKEIDYSVPPEPILNFTRKLCEKQNFQFMAVDIFEDNKGNYLVNELQTIFGHVQDYILEVDNKPGRYIYKNNHWIFEEGKFNTNESYDLRLETALDLNAK